MLLDKILYWGEVRGKIRNKMADVISLTGLKNMIRRSEENSPSGFLAVIFFIFFGFLSVFRGMEFCNFLSHLDSNKVSPAVGRGCARDLPGGHNQLPLSQPTHGWVVRFPVIPFSPIIHMLVRPHEPSQQEDQRVSSISVHEYSVN